MLKITAEEIHFIIHQYLRESGFDHSAFVFTQEANMYENRFNEYRIPSGMLIVFLEKALTLIHMETHLDDNEDIKVCKQPYSLLTPHTCDASVEQQTRTNAPENMQGEMMLIDNQDNANGGVNSNLKNKLEDAEDSHGGLKGANDQARKAQNQQQVIPAGFSEMDQYQAQQQEQQHMYGHHTAGLPGQASPFNNFYPGGNGLTQTQLHQQRQLYQQQFLMQQMAAAAAGAGGAAHNIPPEFGGHLGPQFSFGMENQAHAQEAAYQQNYMMHQAYAAQQQHAQNMQNHQPMMEGQQQVGDQGANNHPVAKDSSAQGPGRQIVPMENNPEQGVILVRPTNQETNGDADIQWTQFSPTQRLLFMGGNFDKPSLWDLRSDNSDNFKQMNVLPHVQAKPQDTAESAITDVISVHWNHSGDKLVTSSDSYARVWKVDEQDKVGEDCKGVHRMKNLKMMLMMSKFNKYNGDQIACGGMSSQVTVWNSETGKVIVVFDHDKLEKNFVCCEIEWQNQKQLVVAGKSKNIYLWNVDQQETPIQKWQGHHADIVQIKWDPTGQLLASCSTDPYCCVWQADKSSPVQMFQDLDAHFNTIRWSNGLQDVMLATGGNDGFIRIWCWKTRKCIHQLNHHAHPKEGVNALAFSPDNRLIASGSNDNIIIWQLNNEGQGEKGNCILRHFQRKPSYVNMPGTTGGIIGGQPGESGVQNGFGGGENQQVEEGPSKNVTELSWSHDGMLLAAAIDEATAIFDIRKLSQPLMHV